MKVPIMLKNQVFHRTIDFVKDIILLDFSPKRLYTEFRKFKFKLAM